jgi:OFA family oxalate/formate antiporter-like MFS transporter
VNRYIMLTMTFVAQMCLGCSYAWSVFAMALKEQYAIEPWQAMSFYSVSTATFAFTTLLSGRLQDRFGPREISIIGGLLYGGGYALGGAWAHTYGELLLTLGVMPGLGLGAIYPCILATCVKWFPASKGLIAGLAVSGYALGAVCVTWVAERLLFTGAPAWLQGFLGWFGAKFLSVRVGGTVISGTSVDLLLTWLGVVVSVIVVAGAVSLSVPREERAEAGARRRQGQPLPWRDTRLWGLFGGFFAGSLAGVMVVTNMKQIGATKGIMAAAFGIMLFNVFSAGGRVSWGWISDRIGGRRSMILGLLLQGSAMLAIPGFADVPVEKKQSAPSIAAIARVQAAAPCGAVEAARGAAAVGTGSASGTRLVDWMFYVLAACFGFFYANNFALYPAEVARIWGEQRMGAIYGVVFSAFAFAGLAGPTAAAWIFGRTGTYNTACVLAALLCAIGAGVVALAVRTRPNAVSQAEAVAATE